MARSQRSGPETEWPRTSGGSAPRPLSYAQERLWWFGQVVGNAPTAVRLRGALNVDALEQALRLVADRHALLRTRFRLDCGTPVQEVVPDVHIEIPVVDLQHLPPADGPRVDERVLAAASERAFDVERPPLLRSHLFRLAPDDHVLLVTLSYLVADEWSRQQLIQDIAVLCAALAAGAPPPLPPLRAQYGDFALWERDELAGPATATHLEFWRAYLADLPPLLELPADRPRPPRRAYRGAWRSRELGPSIRDGVRTLARAEGVTPFHVLLAGFATLLARQTGSADIAVGMPFSHRRVPYERVIGPFLNSVVVRLECSSASTFRALLQHVRDRAVAALAHGQVPFEMVVDALRPERDPSYNPLVQMWFVHKRDEAAAPLARWDGPVVTPIELHQTATPFDITLSVSETDERLTAVCIYDTALFDEDTIDRLLDQWSRLLSDATTDPGRPIHDYDLLSAEERHRQLVGWNETAVRLEGPGCVHDAIWAAAARHADAIAVSMDERHLSYGALRAAALRLAARVRRAGVSLEARVAVVMDRSPDLVVSLAGVLEAGGVCVPLDPDTTPARLQTILRETEAACVVTTRAHGARVAAFGLPVVAIDDDAGDEATDGRAGAAVRPCGENLCFVTYTACAPGGPRPVAMTHAGVTNLLDSTRRASDVTQADAVLAIAPVAHERAVLEIFLPLTSGARLALAPGGVPDTGIGLCRRLASERISVMQAAPADWRRLLDAEWRPAAAFRAICGGEPLFPELARRLIAAGCQIVSCYGAAETTICATVDRLDSADAPASVGRPIANTSAYLLDRRLQPAPVGVAADLYVAGDGLARGYLADPSLTASRFLPDPFGARPGGRMFATGDTARYRADGRLVWRGRDTSATLRGRRIALDAIVEALLAHEVVQEALVLLRDDAAGAPMLVAYVAVAPRAPRAQAGLWRHLSLHLPAYMFPSAIVVVDRLPRTRDGATDRSALPSPAASDLRTALPPVSPASPSEQAIAAIWCDVLGTGAIGIEDDFFALGGNSVQAVRVLLLMRTVLDVDVSLRTFFDAPTVAALARHADEMRRDGSASMRSATVPRVPREGPLTLAPQQENWWYNEHLAGHVNPFNVQFEVRCTGPLQPMAVEQAVAMLQRRHEGLRTMFVVDESGVGRPVIVPPEACDIRVTLLDLTGHPPAVQDRVLHRVSQPGQNRPFDLTRETLCRVVVARLGPDDHVIMFTTHHLVCDGWSADLLITEFSALYAASAGGAPAQLPELPFQYVDFAQWQRDWLAGPGVETQLAYWRRQLAPPLPELLPDAPGDDEPEDAYLSVRGRVPFAIGAEAADAARRLAETERCTLFSTLLAALKLVLYAHTGQPDVRVGTLAANRGLPGAAHVMGLFTDVVCLRTRIDRAARFRDLIRAVHATIGSATANQDLPFEVLARALEAAHGTPRSRLFQVFVLWQAMPAGTLRLPGVAAAMYRQEARTEPDEPTVVLVRNTLDLRLELLESPAGIDGSMTFNLTRFAVEEIRELARCMNRCLTAAAADREITLDAVCGLMPGPPGTGAGVDARRVSPMGNV